MTGLHVAGPGEVADRAGRRQGDDLREVIGIARDRLEGDLVAGLLHPLAGAVDVDRGFRLVATGAHVETQSNRLSRLRRLGDEVRRWGAGISSDRRAAGCRDDDRGRNRRWLHRGAGWLDI